MITPQRIVVALVAVAAVFLAGTAALPTTAVAGAASFTLAAYYPAGTGPQALVVVDANADGRADIVTANDDGARLLRGNGRGRFAAPVRLPAGFFTMGLAAGDFNTDGWPDLAMVDVDDTIATLLNDGLGRFAVASRVTDAGSPLVVADFNGDARPDVVTTSALLLGDGVGGFSLGDPVPLGPEPEGLGTADFNNDGKADLATVNFVWDEVEDARILLGDGAGHFTVAGTYPPYYVEPHGVLVGDLNGDGRQDVVTTESLEGTFALGVLLGDGSGGFTRGPGLILPDRELFGLCLGEFDGDGRLDVAGVSERAIVVLRGDGHGGFLKGQSFPVRRYLRAVTAADINGDSLLDLVADDYVHDAVAVLLNGPRVAPLLTSLSPAKGRVGATITVTGAHFGARRGAGVVTFGGTAVTSYVTWSGAKVKVRVPAGTPKGPVKVRVRTVAGSSAARSFVRL